VVASTEVQQILYQLKQANCGLKEPRVVVMSCNLCRGKQECKRLYAIDQEEEEEEDRIMGCHIM
jgi:hypothetical protein